MKLFTCLSALLCLATHLYSQGSIHGNINDRQKPVESATISLMKSNDSSLVKVSITDAKGNFDISGLAYGQYFIKASAIGFKEAIEKSIVLDDAHNNITLAGLSLERTTTTLQSVSVQSRRPLVEQKIDRTVVNVDAAISNVGATALEVLEKSPGVTVDKDGNISLKGKQGVTILIDGKPAYVSGSDLVSLLRTMNANQLDQVEIMTNPSTKYDAAGNSGIINIKTKKNKTRGFNGNVSLNYGQGIYARSNNSLGLNYRTAKFNLFGNYGYSVRNGSQDLHILRSYYAADRVTLTQLFEQPTNMVSAGSSNNLKIGMDYFLDKRTTLGLVANGFVSPQDFHGRSTGFIKDANGDVNTIAVSENFNKDKWKNHSLNLNLAHKLDSSGTEINADLDYIAYSNNATQSFINRQYDKSWNPNLNEEMKGILPVDINIWSGKVDFSTTLTNKIKFESGLKSSLVNTDNAANYFNLISGNWQADYGKTNHFAYRENINAAYVNFNREINKWSFQAGLRYENTNYAGKQFGNVQMRDSSFTHHYSSFFPTAFISYQADKDNRFTITLGKRIDRPNYRDLNPFLYYINKYTYVKGNPFLLPQYTNNLELTHSWKNRITTTLNFSKTSDFFSGIFQTVGDTTILMQGNLATRKNAGIAVNAEIPVQKWWNLSLNSNFQYTDIDGFANGDVISSRSSTYTIRGNNQLTFNKGFSAEVSGFYNSKSQHGQVVVKPFGQLDIGFSKQLMSNKLTLRMNVKDVLNTSTIDGTIHYQNVTEHFVQTRESRIVNLGVSWRFGKAIKDRKRSGSAGDEQNRVSL